MLNWAISLFEHNKKNEILAVVYKFEAYNYYLVYWNLVRSSSVN
jgi:hypothetical protein